VALWSGDIPASFPALAKSIRAGLNVAMSASPWWTTTSAVSTAVTGRRGLPELMVRWFQFGGSARSSGCTAP